MCPDLPENIRMLGKDELEMATLRVAIMSEFDCINTYEQILSLVKEGALREELLRILGEDKSHAVVLQKLLSEKEPKKTSETPVAPETEDYNYEY